MSTSDSKFSFVVGAIYFGTYALAFLITSIYCAIVTKKTMKKDESCFDKIKEWIKMTFKFKKLYLAIIPHLFDQATDIGVLYEYYTLQFNPGIKDKINTAYLFWASLICLLGSRIISSIAIYKLTRKYIDFFLGLLDLVMVKAIYLGYFLKREQPTNIQRYIGL